jgi:hypothetical protein
MRIALPASPQGEAVSFTADGTALLVAGEGLPGDVTLVPVPARTPAPTSSAAPADPSPAALLDGGGTGLSAIVAGLIAAAVATVLLWIGGRVRRGRPAPPASG